MWKQRYMKGFKLVFHNMPSLYPFSFCRKVHFSIFGGVKLHDIVAHSQLFENNNRHLIIH